LTAARTYKARVPKLSDIVRNKMKEKIINLSNRSN